MNPHFVSLFALNFVNNPKLFADAKHTSELAIIKQILNKQTLIIIYEGIRIKIK